MTQQIDRDEQFRLMHAQHLRDEAEHIQRQTSALESIRSMMSFFVILAILSLIGSIVSIAAALSDGGL